MAALLGVASTGCGSAGYLAHVSLGQMRLLLERELLTPERVAQLSPDEREGLEQLRRARSFGESLGLRQSSSYRHLTDGHAAQGISVVVAAPPDRVEPVTWWFPIVGRVSYRGYFDPERARAFADRLAERGFDTYVRPAPLYSTLGFFDDPIPRPLLRWPPVELVDTAIHEQVHETVFVAGDVAYSEALATFIAERATLALFEDSPALQERARQSFRDRREFARLLDELAEELEVLYAEAGSPDDARRRRGAVFRRYQQEVFPARSWETQRYAGFREAKLSNAYLVANRTYIQDLAGFQAELERLGGDLRTFIREHREDPGHREADPTP